MAKYLIPLVVIVLFGACSHEPTDSHGPAAGGDATAMMKPIEGGDTQAIACRGIRNNVETLVAEYKNASEERRSEILTEIDGLGRQWNQAGCRARYGDMYAITGSSSPALQERFKLRNTEK